MKFDTGKFLSGCDAAFGRRNRLQETGLVRLLNGYETYYGWWDFVPQIANSLAQIKLETAHSFNPVVEGYYLGDSGSPNYYTGNTERVRHFQERLRYYPHFGRGDIQLTWEENYSDFDGYVRKYFPEIVAEFETRTGRKFNLIEHPEQALDGKISFCIMTVGMHRGYFRHGHSLDRYINPREVDYFNARDIVNGDKRYKNKQGERIGDIIVRDSKKFERILNAALVEATEDDLLDVSAAAPSPFEALAIEPREPSTWPSEYEPSPSLDESQAAPGDDPPPTDRSANLESNVGIQTTPEGDAPEVAPSKFFDVEDWKPFAVRWLKRIWGAVTGLTLPGGGGLSIAALRDMPNWYIYAAVAVAGVIALVVFGLIASLPFLVIWLWNRREILHLKMAQLNILSDPTKKNIGLNFERK